jgi:hypothetical protein
MQPEFRQPDDAVESPYPGALDRNGNKARTRWLAG